MRRLSVGVITFAAVVLTFLAVVSPASTQSPTATPSPAPTPDVSSSITVRFVRDGQPVSIKYDRVEAWVGEYTCASDRGGEASDATLPFAQFLDLPFIAHICSPIPPLAISVRAVTDYGYLKSEIQWSGGSITVELEVPREVITYSLRVWYTHNGIPVIGPDHGIEDGGGRPCGITRPAVVIEAMGTGLTWPVPQDPDCGRPGEEVKICVGDQNCAVSVWQPGKVEVKELNLPRGESSFVVARFVAAGAPTEVTVDDWEYEPGCSTHVNTAARKVQQLGRFWHARFYAVSPCGVPGTEITARFHTLEYGWVEGKFVWQGSDVTFDVQLPVEQPVQPRELPQTGGPAN